MSISGPRASIRFGTDGWRAVIAAEFTFENLERVAQAYAEYLRNHRPQSAPVFDPKLALVVIGFDRRFLSEKFAERTADVMAGNGFRVAMFDEAVPTPLVSWAVKEQGAAGGIVITASHNPPEFNGFKIKAPWGGSADPGTTSIVEGLVDASPTQKTEFRKTEAEQNQISYSIESYRKQLADYVDLERICSSVQNVVIDPMHGSGGRWVESF